MSYRILTYSVDNFLNYSMLNKDDIFHMIKSSKLLGRGGAAFPVYRKWEAFISSNEAKKYIIINLHEGEPGCRKDAYLVQQNSRAVIDGALITKFATNATDVILATKESIAKSSDICKLAESCDIKVHITDDRYIAGEETALIELIETGIAYPRPRPPYPVVRGLYGHPTLVHNAETLANISYIAKNGTGVFCETGTNINRGTKIFCISGDVNNECVFEDSFGIALKKAINDYAGGIKGDSLYAIIPGFSRMIKECSSINLDYESFSNAGSHLGTGNIFVFTSKESLVEHTKKMVNFLSQSSCSQCATCRTVCKTSNLLVSQNMYNKNAVDKIICSARGLSRCSFMNSMLDMLDNYFEALQC